jgi:hypothetical protein
MRISFENATTSQFKTAARHAGLAEIPRWLKVIESDDLSRRDRNEMTELMRKLGYIEVEFVNGLISAVKTPAPVEKFVRRSRRRE